MAGLRYRPDWPAARERLTSWWNGGDIGRAAILVQARREEPWEEIPALPEPPGWTSRYCTFDVPYSINLALRSCLRTVYLGEAVPSYPAGDVAPGALSLYLGCTGVEQPGTVWLRPCIDTPETARFEYDPDNFYWRHTREVLTAVLEEARGKFLQQFPDLIEGLDVLAAMRGTQALLLDLLDRPEWVRAALRQVTDRYFRYYDILYDLIRDEVGGSVFWCWAPGRIAKLQCDCSAMLSPALFHEFMVPVLTEMTERLSYTMYHLDGVQATVHVDALIEIPRLDMIQWTSGTGNPSPWDEAWWSMYHRILDAGKKLYLPGIPFDRLGALKREFGQQSKQLLLSVWAQSLQEAEACLRVMEC